MCRILYFLIFVSSPFPRIITCQVCLTDMHPVFPFCSVLILLLDLTSPATVLCTSWTSLRLPLFNNWLDFFTILEYEYSTGNPVVQINRLTQTARPTSHM
ncbi:hypothetical protein HOY80DRAFT_972373 [Tuber brumale]|nr:hypothetical protein HOY80DRAFT_972373 [Tuber brumale]